MFSVSYNNLMGTISPQRLNPMPDITVDAKACVLGLDKYNDLPTFVSENNFNDLYQSEVKTKKADPWQILANAMTASDIKKLNPDELKQAIEKVNHELPEHILGGLTLEVKLLQLYRSMEHEYQHATGQNIKGMAKTKLESLDLYSKNKNAIFTNIRGLEVFILQHRSAHYHKAKLNNANLNNVIFKFSTMQDIDFSESQMEAVDCRNANFIGCKFERAYLKNADLANANLADTNFSLADLSFANFSGANLEGVNFSNANLSSANLSGAILKKIKLQGADLYGTKFLSQETILNPQKRFKNELETVLSQVIGTDNFNPVIAALEANVRENILTIGKKANNEAEWNVAHDLLKDSREIMSLFFLKQNGKRQPTKNPAFLPSFPMLDRCEKELTALRPNNQVAL